jgi:hypothetical protein
MSSQSLSTCNCCYEVQIKNMQYNAPGLSVIAYRIGTHGSFKSSMLKEISKKKSLKKLTARADDDPTIALLDSWSSVLDVLSFYQERIANEGYIRTAAERQSILELARAIGYELSPGVAASTYLVFNLETAPGAPTSAKISKGTKAQTIPGQDEKPQIFETVEDIQAYEQWNQLKVKSSKNWQPKFGRKLVFLKGTSTNLKKGDALLIVGDERLKDQKNENWDFRRIISVETFNSAEQEKSYTKVIVDRGLGSFQPPVQPTKINPKVYALRQRAALFGFNAPDWKAMPTEIQNSYCPETGCHEWPNFNIAYSSSIPINLDSIYLDTIYAQVVKGSWMVLSTPKYQELYKVDEISEESQSDFTLSSKTSKLKLLGENLVEKFSNKLRKAVVYAQSEELEIADEPITGPVSGDFVILDKIVDGLFKKQILIISGKEINTDVAMNEVVSIKEIMVEGNSTKLIFNSNLKNSYQSNGVIIYANVAKATHGETKSEILGSGDASKSFQKFTLKQNPLTYISSSAPSGSESTLEIRVNNILWEETPSFYNVLPNKRVYVTRLADDGSVTIQFGDGVNGSRLPTGVENVSANYRVGIGLEGLVNENQISLLMTRPLGVKNVTNPFAPDGAADSQNLSEARKNAPLTVLTLDRIVSLQDYEDFAQAFSGIGKSKASAIWDGENQFVHLTIAGVNGSNIETESELYKNLLLAIDKARYPDVFVKADNFKLLLFNLEAKIYINKNYNADKVLSEVESNLTSAFSFQMRSFGQAVTLSEVVAVMQVVEGVIYIDVDKLYLASKKSSLNTRIAANLARIKNKLIKPAELILINPDEIKLTGVIQ